MFDIDRFMAERVPLRLSRHYFRGQSRLRRCVRSIRFRRMPKGGWGTGWRVLVFRYDDGGPKTQQLHVLAPVRGEEFDWEVLRLHVRGKPWPSFVHQSGHLRGVLKCAGNHIGVTTDEHGTQRIPMARLMPGEFRGGVDVNLVLLDVRDADLRPEDGGTGQVRPRSSTA